MSIIKLLIICPTLFVVPSLVAQELSWVEHLEATNILGPAGLVAGDLNSDGDVEGLVLYSAQGKVRLSQYSQTFESMISNVIVINETDAINLNLGDIDGDGFLDIVVPEWNGVLNNGYVSYYRNLGNQFFSFSDRIELTSEVYNPRNLALGDFNGDSHLDIVVATETSVEWLENDGQAHFAEVHVLANNSENPRVSAFDYDDDGDYDIIASNFIGDQVALFENTGDGNFVAPITLTDQVSSPAATIFADIDNDGDEDAVVNYTSGQSLHIYENLGSGEFGTEPITLPCQGRVADIDLDGNLDIVGITSGSSDVEWFENQGDFVFESHHIADLGDTFKISLGDFDGDGDIDVRAASWYLQELWWYENQINPGCMDNTACNFDPNAAMDDNSCLFEGCYLDADFNGDDTIDISDLLFFLSLLGCDGSECTGDLNGDLVVNALDLLTFLGYFGSP